jgi:hypothetical protein
MQATRTLFVVGAGASCEFGLPAGRTLTQHIAQSFEFARGGGDDLVRHALQARFGAGAGGAMGVANGMTAGLRVASSIDRFLDIHATDEVKVTAGKIGIVHSILEAERSSSICVPGGGPIPFTSTPGRAGLVPPIETWLGVLFQLLQEKIRQETPEEIFRNVAFISFNYDRCIEHFMYWAARALFGLDEAATVKAMCALTVHHPYGQLGPLPWQAGRSEGIPFGQQGLSADSLVALADDVRTFTEQIQSGAPLQAIRADMELAERIVFLGFGFHAQNMDLLTPAEPCQATEVFATTFEQSESDVDISCGLIRKCLSGSERSSESTARTIRTSPKRANDFLVEWGRYLQLA